MLSVRDKQCWIFAVCVVVAVTGGCGGGSSGGSNPTMFTLSPSPDNLTVAQGSQGASIISITPQNGFSGSVSFTASGLPTGVTAAFTPQSGTTSSTLTLSAGITATTGAGAVTVTGTSGSSTNTTTIGLNVTPPQRGGLIQHIVIIVQENRSPDNLFQDPNLISNGADIQSYGYTSNGSKVTLTPVSGGLVTSYDLGHTHASFLDACDYNSTTNTCAMDGADLISCGPGTCPTNPEYQYVQQQYVQPYWTMAETYTFADRMFQTNEGPSFPAHQYLLAGTSTVCVPGASCPSGVTSSSFAVSDNPGGNERSDGTSWAGCLAPPGSYVNFIDTSQASPAYPTVQLTDALCAEHPTLTDLLQAVNVSWTYYAPMAGSIWTAPDAIQHICDPSPAYPSETSTCTGADWVNHVVLEGSGAQIITDINNGALATVSWVIPTSANSDHAAGNKGTGPSWVASIVNAIGESQYWQDTAIFVTWDDWGGWYDHVPPSSIRDSYEYGLRVPMIVISPYAKAAYVSHVNHDFGSILKFVETQFSLGQIDSSVGFADSRSDDLSDCFDFNQTPLVFQQIPAPQDASYFLNDKSPPGPPDDY
jgi:phospholipase C